MVDQSILVKCLQLRQHPILPQITTETWIQKINYLNIVQLKDVTEHLHSFQFKLQVTSNIGSTAFDFDTENYSPKPFMEKRTNLVIGDLIL